jgi:hypothetical protein
MVIAVCAAFLYFPFLAARLKGALSKPTSLK